MNTQISLAILLGFIGVSLAMGLYSRTKHKNESLLVAGRNLKTKTMGLSIAATWIWAPALFVSAEKAYIQGLAGLLWFTVPNVACLVIFGWFMSRFIRHIPNGFTLSSWMGQHKSKRVQRAYLFQFLGLIVCGIAVQLLAGATLISSITGLNYYLLVILLAGGTLIYSMVGGIRASVTTDRLQMLIILVVGIPIIIWAATKAGGSAIMSGLGGISGDFINPLNTLVVTTFGIPTTIGLMAGPFGDQTFYQRAFSQKPENIFKSFLIGAGVFAIVPLFFSLPGFSAAGAGLEVTDTQLTNVAAIAHFLPDWVIYPFILVLLAGLVTTVDSKYAAAGSFSYDFAGNKENPKWIRTGMLLAAIAGTGVAFIPGMAVVYLFMFYGMLRASTFMPTVLTLFNRTSERGMFWGIVAALTIGLPVFAYGNFNGIPSLIIIGSLLTLGLSGVLSIVLKDRRDCRYAKTIYD